MKNPLTVSVESYLGIVFLAVLSLILVVFFFSASRKLESDLDVINLQIEQIRAVPSRK